MKKIFLSALLASSTLVIFADSVFAKDCALKDGTQKIIVNDPNNSITLRTNYEKEGRDVPDAGKDKPIIGNGETLLINNGETPKLNKSDDLCYYPVKLTRENNSRNTNEKILEFSLYWISEEGIKDYQTLVTNSAPIPSPTKLPNAIDSDDSPGWSLPSWLPGVSNFNFTMNLFTLVLLGFIVKKIIDISKKIIDISSTLDQNNKKFTSSFQAQNSKFDQLQNLPSHIERNKEHIKQLEALLKSQNQYLDGLGHYIKGERLSNSISDSLKKTFEAMLESRQSELNKPGLAPAGEQNEDSQQETEQTNYHDPFYDEVISQFNTASLQWFSSLIEQRNVGKVQITKDSVLGQMDMGGKVTQLELNEQGTLLIYQAGEKLWVIPDLTQPKWKRYVPDSLFSGNGQSLVSPAEVESVGNNLWQLVEKGQLS